MQDKGIEMLFRFSNHVGGIFVEMVQAAREKEDRVDALTIMNTLGWCMFELGLRAHNLKPTEFNGLLKILDENPISAAASIEANNEVLRIAEYFNG